MNDSLDIIVLSWFYREMSALENIQVAQNISDTYQGICGARVLNNKTIQGRPLDNN